MKFNFKNKTVLITGGEGGLGKSICSKFAELGAKVIITTTNKKLISKKGKKKSYAYLDFNNKNSIQKFFNDPKKINKVDILINNAGINMVSLINDVDEKYLDEIYRVNLRGPIIMTKQISKIMIKRRKGKIINITSVVGHTGNLGQTNYTASKAGIVAMSKSLAIEYAKKNITINCVSPGFIVSDMTMNIAEKVKLYLTSRNLDCLL